MDHPPPGILYAEEYGWDQTFEALVAEIATAFVKTFDPERERCWIAVRWGAAFSSWVSRTKLPSSACFMSSPPHGASASGFGWNL